MPASLPTSCVAAAVLAVHLADLQPLRPDAEHMTAAGLLADFNKVRTQLLLQLTQCYSCCQHFRFF
jgi:hypothetical protein